MRGLVIPGLIMHEKYPIVITGRYMMNNIKADDKSVKYSAWVPPVLRNRPRSFISHALNRLKSGYAEKAPFSQIASKKFAVQSETVDRSYEVDLTGSLPHCEFTIRWALLNQKVVAWDDFPTSYQNCPVFSLGTLEEKEQYKAVAVAPPSAQSSRVLAHTVREHLGKCLNATYLVQRNKQSDGAESLLEKAIASSQEFTSRCKLLIQHYSWLPLSSKRRNKFLRNACRFCSL